MSLEEQNVVIVTGASGFIGSAVVDRLSKSFRVVGLDNRSSPHFKSTAELITVDISTENSVEHAFDRVRHQLGDRIASVIHLAAYSDFSGEPSPLYETVNVRGTERLLWNLKSFQVEQFVFGSTMMVYAPTMPGQPIKVGSPIGPKWDDAKAKAKAERIVREQRRDIPIVLLRMAGVYDDGCHSVPLAHQIQRIYERQIVSGVFPGDASHGQAFVHLDDLVDAIERIVDRRATLPPETTLIVGEPETLSYRELQDEFGRLIHNEKWQTREISKSWAKTGAWLEEKLPGKDSFIKPWMIDIADSHYELDVSAANSLLGWTPTHSLRNTLPKMVAGLKADPVNWYRVNELTPPSLFGKATHNSPQRI